jgi:hypothetical protein
MLWSDSSARRRCWLRSTQYPETASGRGRPHNPRCRRHPPLAAAGRRKRSTVCELVNLWCHVGLPRAGTFSTRSPCSAHHVSEAWQRRAETRRFPCRYEGNVPSVPASRRLRMGQFGPVRVTASWHLTSRGRPSRSVWTCGERRPPAATDPSAPPPARMPAPPPAACRSPGCRRRRQAGDGHVSCRRSLGVMICPVRPHRRHEMCEERQEHARPARQRVSSSSGSGLARNPVAVQAAKPRRANALAVVVGNHDVERGHSSAAVQQRRYTSDQAAPG